MKRALLILLLLVSITTIAQQGINYKALIKDASNAVVSNTLITVQFTILKGVAQNSVYEETHTPTTDANGIIVINIGEGSVNSGDFETIDWKGGKDHFLKTRIDTGAGLIDMGTTAFKTVPYALHATTATTATELTGGIDQAYIAALEAQIAALQPGPPAVVGDLRSGGVVFWVDPVDNSHGLVCALSDYPIRRQWGCSGTDLLNVTNVSTNRPEGVGAEIGDGIFNTIFILTDCLTAPAALAARSLGTEWFLPSVKELNQMYINRTTLEAAAGFAPFQNNSYWCSTEANSIAGWVQLFSNGAQVSGTKSSTIYVRAVRAF